MSRRAETQHMPANRPERENTGNTPAPLYSPTRVRALLDQLGVRPSKPLGQNFMIDGNTARIAADASGAGPGDAVLEIGPGLGALTERLAERAGRLVAIEKDARLAAYLSDRFADRKAVDIWHADALDGSLHRALDTGITHVAANLPYSVAGRMLVEIIERTERPCRMAVTVQKDVALRFTAEPGTHDFGPLAIWSGRVYRVERVRDIPRTCFLPRPNVDSSLVVFEARRRPLAEPDDPALFYEIVKRSFMARRKKMINVVKEQWDVPDRDTAALLLERAGVDPDVRPSDVHVLSWVRLSDEVARHT